MGKQTRVEKYKKLRDEITRMDIYKFENPYTVDEEDENLHDVGMSKEELKSEHIKKSTLSISIDQIVKAHDEYTSLVAQEKKKNSEKETKKLRFRKLMNRLSIVLIAVLLLVIIVLVIIIFRR